MGQILYPRPDSNRHHTDRGRVCCPVAPRGYLCPRKELNFHLTFRKRQFYPLNYEDKKIAKTNRRIGLVSAILLPSVFLVHILAIMTHNVSKVKEIIVCVLLCCLRHPRPLLLNPIKLSAYGGI
jgi:hypothetical protein